MTYHFGERSTGNLATCHPDLDRLFREVIRHVDCAVIEGHRDEARQERLFSEGKTQLHWPDSNHNGQPSRAVDVMAYPIQWNNSRRNAMFAGFVLGIAAGMGIKIRAGIDWNGNFDPEDNWIDAPHFELMRPGA